MLNQLFPEDIKLFKLFITSILFALASSASAVPLLQIYIEDATYHSSSDTWVTTSTSFNVWVIANTNGAGSKGPLRDVTLVATAITGNLNNLTITGGTTSLVDDPSIASTPTPGKSGTNSHDSLSDHGVFKDDNPWQEFSLGDMLLSDSPLGDATQGGFPEFIDGAPGSAQINVYHIEKATPYTSIHFDVFGFFGTKNKYTSAPYSHDAESLAIDEPASLALILFGIFALNFRKKKQITLK